MVRTVTARSSCGTCGQPILWTTTEAGRCQPVDAEPATTGVVLVRWEGRVAHSRVYRPDDDNSPPPYGHERRHVPHAATCRPPASSDETLPFGDLVGNVVSL